MGLFDNLFLAVDLVKGGVASFKASERLEELAGQAIDFYDQSLTEDNRRLYNEYQRLKGEYDALAADDDSSAKMDEMEKALVAFLISVSGNPAISNKFSNDINTAIAEWQKCNDMPTDIFEKYMMKNAKTEEERAAVRKVLNEINAEGQE